MPKLPWLQSLVSLCLLFSQILPAQPSARAAAEIWVRIGSHSVTTTDDWVDVPILIEIPENQVMQSIRVKINYDPALFQITGCFSNFTNSACHSNLAGEAQLMISAAVGITGSYDLGTLRFLAKGRQGSSTDLLLEIIELTDKNGAALVGNVQPGLLCIGVCVDPQQVRQQAQFKLTAGQWLSMLSVPVLGFGTWWLIRRRYRKADQ